MYNVKMYSENYDKVEFYSIMGKFFAEREYKRVLPYLSNDKDKIWYLFFNKEELVGFCGVKKMYDYINFMDIFVVNESEKNILKFMCSHIFKIYKKNSIKVVTDKEKEIEIWLNYGFEKEGTKGHYQNLVWTGKHE